MALKIGEVKRKDGLILYGSFYGNNATGKFNRLIASSLIQNGNYDVGLAPDDDFNKNAMQLPFIIDSKIGKIPAKIKFHLSHQVFEEVNTPDDGHWIVISPWEYGSFPVGYLESMKYNADEIWVGSEYAKKCAMREGLDESRLAVISGGIDPKIFNNTGVSPMPDFLKKHSPQGFKFLFAGDATWDKGMDLVIKAFKDEFLYDEAVSLIVKDQASSPLTIRQNYINEIKEAQQSEDFSQIIYMDNQLNDDELASLYKTCDCFVFPYRVENYALNVLEAMACGMPVIVSDHGVIQDFCNEDNSYLIRSRFMKTAEKNVAGMETVDNPIIHEPNLLHLRQLMRQVYEDYQEAQHKGIKASQHILENFTWQKAADKIYLRLNSLKDKELYRKKQAISHNKIIAGLNAYERENYDQAISYLKEVVEEGKADAVVLFDLGLALMQTKQYNEAVNYLAESIKKEPTNSNSFNIIGLCLFNLGEYALSKMFFEKVIEIDPEHEGAKDSLKNITKLIIENEKVDNKLFNEKYRELMDLLPLAHPVITKEPTISLCMIVKDEESFIAQCLESAKDVVNEIIVVDTGSTDKTVEIAESYGAKVHKFKWTNNFSDARNEALKHATCDWILILDADEVLDPENKHNLRQLIKIPSDKIRGYQIKIKNYTSEKEATVEHYTIRVFPNNPKLRYHGVIHEQIDNSEDSGNFEKLLTNDVIILHYGYSKQVMDDRSKDERNLQMLEKAIAEDKDNSFHYFNLGLTHKVAGNLDKSLEAFKTSLEMTKKDNVFPAFIQAVYGYIIALLDETKKYEDALEYIKEGEQYCSINPDYWLNCGSVYTNLKDYDKAIDCFKEALKLNSVDFTSVVSDPASTTWKPNVGIGNVYLNKKDKLKALHYWRLGLKESPANKELLLNIARLALEVQNSALAEKTLLKLMKIQNKDEQNDTKLHLANVYINQNRIKETTELLDSIKDSEALFKSLIQTYFILGRYNEMIEIYDGLIKKDKDNAEHYIGRGLAFYKLKDFETAEKDFRKATELDPGISDAWGNLGAIYLTQKDVAKAEEYHLKAISLNDEAEMSYYDLGKIQIYKQDYEKAKEYLEKAVNLNSNIEILQLLADVYQTLNDTDKALSILVTLMDDIPDDVNNLIQIGNLLTNIKEYEKAVDVFSRAMDLDPKNSIIYKGAGLALMNLGKYEDSYNAFSLALTIDPDDIESKKGLDMLIKFSQSVK